MKIRCQEHYDKVVEYAKSIGDTTFRIALNASNNGRRTQTAGMKLNSTGISPHIHSVLRKWPLTEAAVLSEDCFTMENRTSLMRLH